MYRTRCSWLGCLTIRGYVGVHHSRQRCGWYNLSDISQLLSVATVFGACRQRLLDEKLPAPRLYLYSADDDLCVAAKLDQLIEHKKSQCACLSAQCPHQA